MDVNNNDRNESKDQKDIKPVKKEIANIKNNLIKKLEALNGDLSILKSTLISGFKIINNHWFSIWLWETKKSSWKKVIII